MQAAVHCHRWLRRDARRSAPLPRPARRFHGLYAVAKFVEVFSNGVVVFSFRLRGLPTASVPIAAPSVPLLPEDDGDSGGPFGSGWTPPPSVQPAQLEQRGGMAPGEGHFPRVSLLAGASGEDPAASDPMRALRDRRITRLTGPDAPGLDERARDLVRDATLHYVLPRTSCTPLLNMGLCSASEVAYAYCTWKWRVPRARARPHDRGAATRTRC